MKFLLKTFSCVVLCLFITSTHHAIADNTPIKRGQLTGAIEHDMPDWFKDSFLDIQTDIKEAANANKHVAFFFHMDGCPYCDKMVHDGFATSDFKSYIQQNFDVIAINVKGSKEITFAKDQVFTEKVLAEKLNIKITPTVLFLDKNNNAVARLNGYRVPKQFETILHYVADKAYQTGSLADYLAMHKPQGKYTLQNETFFKSISDLSSITTPLAVIFEETGCDECATLHTKTFKDKDVQAELAPFTVVRLDASATQEIIDPTGKKTTPKALAKAWNVTSSPTIILWNEGKERARIDSLLFNFHFKEMFRYVSGKHYATQSDFWDYLHQRQDTLLNQGINIHIGE